jgi:UDP-GlcNAc:undecaprenyl-phosphate GlcNAc-1-phosphate transferase
MGGMLWSVIFCFFTLISFIVVRRMYVGFRSVGWQRVNFEQREIVHGLGISILILIAVYEFLYYTFLPFLPLQLAEREAVIFFMLISVLTLMGWVDDRYGDTETRGLKGHLLAYLQGGLVTTGLLKALIGFLISVTVALLYSSSPFSFALQTLLLLASIHFFNLLDVRPGRSIKYFWLFGLTLLPFLKGPVLLHIILPVWLIALCLFMYDRQRLAMIGDTGSNVLGGIFGYLLLLTAQQTIQFFFLLLFMGLSILAEKYSLTALIKKAWGIR